MLNSAIQVLNEAGHTWWSHVFPLTWTSSLVAVVLLAVIWIGRRWPAQLRYAIVLVALIKFAVPPTLTAPVGLFNWFGPPIIERTEPSTLNDHPFDSEADNSTLATILSAWEQLNWRAQLMLLHVTGMVLAGSWAVSRFLQLVAMAHRAKCVAGGKWFNLLTRLSKQFGLKRPVSLLVSPEAVPPMAFGLLRPYVLVPMSVLQDLPSKQIKTMLAHELAHHKRLDSWINALQNILGIIWWFNPIFRVLNRTIRRVREDCCDDMLVCRNIATDNKYCQILLHIASNLSLSARMIAALGFTEATHPLGRRIKRIMDPKVYHWAKLSFGTVVSIAILAALLLPGLRSELPTTSAYTPLVLEALAPSELQAPADLAEKPPANIQDQTEELVASFPQQIETAQPHNYPTVKTTSNVTVAWSAPPASKTVYNVYSFNQDKDDYYSTANINATVATSNYDLLRQQAVRRNNYSNSAPLLSFVSNKYDSQSNGGGNFGSVGIFGSALAEVPPTNMAAVSFAQNLSKPHSLHSSTSEIPQLTNSYEDTIDLIVTAALSEPSYVPDPATLSTTTEPGDPSQPGITDDRPVLASTASLEPSGASYSAIAAVAEVDLDRVETSAFDYGQELVLINLDESFDQFDTNGAGRAVNNTLTGISKSLIESGSMHRFDAAWTDGMTDTADDVDCVDFVYANDVPSLIDFTNFLIPSSSNSSLTTFSRSNGKGKSPLAIGSSYPSSSSYTTPEPTTIWVLLVGSLLVMHRRKKGL